MGNNNSTLQLQSLPNKPLNEMSIINDTTTASEIKMAAIIFSKHGSAEECLELAHSITRPTPSPGQILVKVHAYGINPLDVKLLETREAAVPLPKIIGCDFSGTVVSIPDQQTEERESEGDSGNNGGSGLRVGDKVLGKCIGVAG